MKKKNLIPSLQIVVALTFVVGGPAIPSLAYRQSSTPLPRPEATAKKTIPTPKKSGPGPTTPTPTPAPSPAAATVGEQTQNVPPEPAKPNEPRPRQGDQTPDDEGLMTLLLSVLFYGVLPAVLFGTAVAGAVFLVKRSREQKAQLALVLGDLRKRAAGAGEKIRELAETTATLAEQVAQHNREIRNLKQQAVSRESMVAEQAMQPAYEAPVARSRFPMMVEDYLAEVRDGAVPVKFDYKESMFVRDGDREAGLVVANDGVDGLLYLIPSFGYFQTRSDYTNYFERYYACASPKGGDVWIRRPARVNAVNGGWQLAGQGELEVR